MADISTLKNLGIRFRYWVYTKPTPRPNTFYKFLASNHRHGPNTCTILGTLPKHVYKSTIFIKNFF